MKEIESLKSRIKLLIDTAERIQDEPTQDQKNAMVDIITDIFVDAVRAARAVWESR